MLEIRMTNAFRHDLKTCRRRTLDVSALQKILDKLQAGQSVDHYRDHALIGFWNGHRELHIANDWLLIYKINPLTFTLTLVRTGTHSDLF